MLRGVHAGDAPSQTFTSLVWTGLSRGGLGRCGVEEFVTFDFCSDTHMAVVTRLDSHNLAVATNAHVAGLRHLFRQGNHELDFASQIEFGVGEKIEAAIADIASTRDEFRPARFMGEHSEGKGHRESPRFTAFGSISHESSLWGL